MSNDNELVDSNETVIAWENLTITVNTSEDTFLRKFWKKCHGRSSVESMKILKGVTGYATTGNLIAIMGPSGAGKTTFLAALAKRIEPEMGFVKLNGKILSRDVASKISSYMPQYDGLPLSLTTEEYITFAKVLNQNPVKTELGVFSFHRTGHLTAYGTHALKLNCTSARRKFLSAKLIFDLGLHDCKDTLIDNLSGGQRKRLSLANELVTSPKILFLDEPTTGLDSFSAIRVAQLLKMITLNGTIVFCTIHQPGMAIYNLFSRVILMADGRTACFGSLENVADFFSSQGYECPIGFDESEYYMKLVSRDPPSSNLNEEQKKSSERIDAICQAFSCSPFSKIPEAMVFTELRVKSEKSASFTRQFYWLIWRTWKQKRRTIFSRWLDWICVFVTMLVFAALYTGINSRTQEGIQNVRGVIYTMTSEVVFISAYTVLYEFPSDLVVYLRESSSYDSGPYFIATMMGAMPKIILQALLFLTELHFLINVEFELCNLLLYYFLTMFATICGIAYGLMFSSWINDFDLASSVMVPIDLLLMLNSGVYYNLRSLPTYLLHVKYVSLFFYFNEALSIIYWSRIDKIECNLNNEYPCLSTGKEVLSEYGFRMNYWWDFLGMATLTIVMAIVGYIGVRRRRMVGGLF